MHGLLLSLLHIKVRLPELLCAVKTVEADFRFCWTISPNVGHTHKENPNLVRIFYMICTWMIYTNSTTNYTNIDTQESVHFAVSRTETRLKMHQTCIWNTGRMQSIAGPVHASAVWTDGKKKERKQKTITVPIGYSLFADHRSVPSFGPGFFCLTLGYLCRNALDITSIGIDDTPLVPGISLCPGILGYNSSGCPTVCVLARLC